MQLVTTVILCDFLSQSIKKMMKVLVGSSRQTLYFLESLEAAQLQYMLCNTLETWFGSHDDIVRTCVSFLRASKCGPIATCSLIGTQKSKIGALTEMTSYMSSD